MWIAPSWTASRRGPLITQGEEAERHYQAALAVEGLGEGLGELPHDGG
jgi:hypothetical protein